MERPKYLEYRHRRDQITCFKVKREVVFSIEKPAAAIFRLVGKKTSAKRDTYSEEWALELRTSDVRPDYSALVKTQITEASRKVKGEDVGYEGMIDPTTEFLNETVDRFGMLKDHHGTLPTPHLALFPEEPQMTGGEWEQSRLEHLPITDVDGRVSGHQPVKVVYRCRVDGYGDEGVEFADISFSGAGMVGEKDNIPWQEYNVTGSLRFAIRDGHMISADVTRSMASHIEGHVLTNVATEEIRHASQGREQSVGGMRI